MPHLIDGRAASRGITLVFVATLLLPLSGCISTDSAPDRRLAIDLAEDHLAQPGGIDAIETDPTLPPEIWNGETPLTSDIAVQVAMARDTGIRRTLAAVEVARADLAQADRAPNPMIQAALGVPLDGMAGAPAMAVVAQQLTWLWTRPCRLDATDAELQASILEAAWTIVSLDAEVRRAHAAAIVATARVDVDREFAETTGRLEFTVAHLFDAGEASRIDLDRIRVEAAEAAVASDASDDMARIARLDLLAAMGLPRYDTDFEVSAEMTDTDEIPTELRVIELAATARLDVAAAGCRVLAAESRSGLAGLRRLPEVGATLGWNRNFRKRDALMPGIAVRLPIFDDGLPAIAAADGRLHDAVLTHLESRRKAIVEARRSRDRLILAEARRRGHEERVLGPAKSAENLASTAYTEGVVDLTVVLLAQQQRIKAQRHTLDFRLEEAIARVDLVQRVGGSLSLDPVVPVVPRFDERLAADDSPRENVR